MTTTLARWYAINGRHSLPWRLTREPWPVLVSEVMLQQTSVARVLGRWERFLERWPDPASCAAAALDDVLREWQGLGYPRRAAALHRTAGMVAAHGWPADEAGLRELPGIGAYTARALLCFCFNGSAVPADVNVARVAARAWAGTESATARDVEAAVHALQRGAAIRDHVFALFDVGATLCRARSVDCAACPLRSGCRSRARLEIGVPPRPRKQAAYAGSHRQLRGAILREMLAGDPPATVAALAKRVAQVAAAHPPTAVAAALTELRREGLVGGFGPSG
jgi:A/G-specific adenine glycosylase